MGLCTGCCLALTLLALLGVTAAYDEQDETFDRALRTLQTFSRLRQVAEERRSIDLQDERRKLSKFCKKEGDACRHPIKLCCGELECYWPDGWSLRYDGICVDCLLENRTCQRDAQCCENMHCEKDKSTNIDGACMRPASPDKGTSPSGRCVGMGQKCRYDSQCCQNGKHHLQCDKVRPISIDGMCQKYRREGACYRDGQCVEDCKRARWYNIYGECE